MSDEVRTKNVDVEEFLEVAISRRRIERADDEAQGFRGLLDVDQGVRYIISELNLDSAISPGGDKRITLPTKPR